MAATEEDVIEALRPVQDPELHRSIVDLEMVRGVRFEGTTAVVLIALTVAGCPLKAEITERVTNAVMPLAGIDTVKVDLTVMTPEELERIRGKMGSHSHGPEHREVPFVNSRTRVIAITSGKGGVGKSTITVNLAAALAAQGHDVGIIDADVYGFSVPQMLGVEDDPIIDDNGLVVPPVAHGVSCISIGFFVEDDKPVMWRGPMLHKALEQFLIDVKWGDLEYLLIDMPPGTGDVAMSMAKQLPQAETYVVTTPQAAAQRVAQRSGAMAREIGLPVAGVIENMTGSVFGEGGGAQLAETLQTSLLAQIPLALNLRESGDLGVPAVVCAPSSELALQFNELATKIVASGVRRVYREELRVR